MTNDFIKVKIYKQPGTDDIPLPEYQTEGSAGMDIHAAIQEEVIILPGERKRIPTGIKIALPHGYEAQIRPRSGLALNYGIGIPNAPGTIDSDYRGEICIILINWGQEPFHIKRGDRIAQMIIAPVSHILWETVTTLPPSNRGPGGFGHTGIIQTKIPE
ncbi:MAG TPA: dUTP diphosphatase [Candidatus Hydrogenedens sp.]|nr:dUTP diphosphatase [Candidatus Hydrogenedens sp.]